MHNGNKQKAFCITAYPGGAMRSHLLINIEISVDYHYGPHTERLICPATRARLINGIILLGIKIRMTCDNGAHGLLLSPNKESE